jgi:ribosomal protein S18 acetylase RimI-like enzyme
LPRRSRIEARLLTAADRAAALALLARDPLQNLLLMESAAGIGIPPPPSEVPPQVVGAWSEDELVSVASLRPSVVLEASAPREAIDAWAPRVARLESGLVKSRVALADVLWDRLQRRGRRVVIDRRETAYALRRGRAAAVEPADGARLRPAEPRDLDRLVVCARASLREEGRPDPFVGDPSGFRRWVRGRLHRARVVEYRGEVVFVGYADVRRREGWLVQGVYTWPDLRGRGFARTGMSALAAEAFAAGADHVQLSVVDGNAPAVALYTKLGFEPFAALRTILFV